MTAPTTPPETCAGCYHVARTWPRLRCWHPKRPSDEALVDDAAPPDWCPLRRPRCETCGETEAFCLCEREA